MKSVKKIFYAIVIITILSACLLNNFVYADVIMTREIVSYSPLYYIAIIVVIAIVVGISIFILRKIYKNNQLQKDEEYEKGEKK